MLKKVKYLNIFFLLFIMHIISCDQRKKKKKKKNENENEVEQIAYKERQPGVQCGYIRIPVMKEVKVIIDNKPEIIKFHGRGRDFCEGGKRFTTIEKDIKELETGNALLINKFFRGILHCYICRTGVGIEGNGKYLLLKHALQKGADVKSIPLTEALPKRHSDFLYNLKEDLRIMALLLAWGMKIDGIKINVKSNVKSEVIYIKPAKEKKYFRTDLDKLYKRFIGTSIYSLITRPYQIENIEDMNTIDKELSYLIQSKDFDSAGFKYDKNYIEKNKRNKYATDKIREVFLRNYLKDLSTYLLKEKQMKRLDPNFLELIKEHKIDQTIIDELEKRTKL